jgi:uncharacterized protein YbdZ (MbtH family)
MVAKQPEPTPFSAVDRFAGVSAASAQKWTSFPIVAPTPLPAALSQGQQQQINAFNVIGFGLGVPETAPANYVLFTYQPPFGSPVYLAETTNDAAVPKISGNTASVLMPLEPDKPQTIEIAPNTLSTLNIESVRVTRFQVLATDTSSNTTYYVWNAGDVNHALWQVVTPLPAGMKGVSDSDLRQMVTSIIQQRAGSNAATATPYVPAASPLPLTVSASGLRITLLAGLRDGHEIVLNFKIEPSDPNQPNLWELGGGAMLKGIIPAEDDVEATGLQWDSQNQAAQIIVPLVPRGTKPQPTPEIPGYTESLPFVLTGQANQPVTVTIHRVRFDHAPSAPPPGKVIDGTWTFTFMPASLPSPASSGSPVP